MARSRHEREAAVAEAGAATPARDTGARARRPARPRRGHGRRRLYDVFAIGDTTVGIAIGDVQGKDARAAGTTSVVRHSLRAGAQERAPAALGLLGEERVREQLAGDAGATADVLATRLDDLARPSAGCGGATTSRC